MRYATAVQLLWTIVEACERVRPICEDEPTLTVHGYLDLLTAVQQH